MKLSLKVKACAEEIATKLLWLPDDPRRAKLEGLIARHFEPKTKAEPDIAETIYGMYPRKVAKFAALKAIRKALKTTKATDLIDSVAAYAYSVKGVEPMFIPHPATWFNSGRWLDEQPKMILKPSSMSPPVEPVPDTDRVKEMFSLIHGNEPVDRARITELAGELTSVERATLDGVTERELTALLREVPA